MSWARVTRSEPCRICGKPDWCTASHDGTACCMRVQSPHPAKNGGWMHFGRAKRQANVPRREPPARPTIDAAGMISRWQSHTDAKHVAELADQLGVEKGALHDLGIAWAPEHNAWAFPMYDGQRNVVGIRLRDAAGHKWAVTGSRQGVFYSPSTTPQVIAFLTEGPTDTAAMLSLGLFAIGRPSCNTGGLALRSILSFAGVRRVALVADNDVPGLNGAARVASDIGLPYVVFLPPTKDIRESVRHGVTRDAVLSSVVQMVWRMPTPNTQNEEPSGTTLRRQSRNIRRTHAAAVA